MQTKLSAMIISEKDQKERTRQAHSGVYMVKGPFIEN